MAKITIGMPVYNGAETIYKAVSSVLGQTYEDFILLISDNASSDSTSLICKKLCALDPRVVYHRQLFNVGPGRNFQYLLDSSTTDFFTWWAADDFRTPEFIERCVRHLELFPSSMAVTGLSTYSQKPLSTVEIVAATLKQVPSLSAASHELRVLSFIDVCWHSHSIFYSVFRPSLVPFPTLMGEPDYVAKDWAWNISLLNSGGIDYIDGEFIVLGTDGVSKSADPWTMFRTRSINWLLPFYQFSEFLLKLSVEYSLTSKIRIFIWLSYLNLIAFKSQLLSALRAGSSRHG